MSENDNKKEITVVSGDGKDLDISPVYDHIKVNKPRSNTPKKDIVIPKRNNNKNDEKK